MSTTNDPNLRLSDVSSKYGAPMGRSDYAGDPEAEVILFAVRMVDGDYDAGGAYWGGGEGTETLYCAMGEEFECFCRAKSRDLAALNFINAYPGITVLPQDVDAKAEEMLDHYILCALWSSMDWSDENTGGESMGENYSREDVAEETVEKMREDCKRFIIDNPECDDLPHAGHDFWLTRNRHGTGFWDRGHPKELGKKWTDYSHQAGSVDLYVGDDGRIYQ